MKKYTLSGTTPSATLRGNLGFITMFAQGGTFSTGVAVEVSPDGTNWFELADTVLTAKGVKNLNVDAPYHRVVGKDASVVDVEVWISGVEA